MLFLFSFWHPYDSDVGMFKVCLEIPKPLIFFEFLFLHSVLVECFLFLLLQIIDFSPGFLPFTVDSLYAFISLSIAFIFSSILWTQTFLWMSWWPVFWTVHLIGCLSFCHLVIFFLELWSVLSLVPFFFCLGTPITY